MLVVLVLFSTIRLFFPPFNDDLGTMPTRRPYSWKKKINTQSVVLQLRQPGGTFLRFSPKNCTLYASSILGSVSNAMVRVSHVMLNASCVHTRILWPTSKVKMDVIGESLMPPSLSGEEIQAVIDLQEFDRLDEFETAVLEQLPTIIGGQHFWKRACLCAQRHRRNPGEPHLGHSHRL